VEGIICWKMRMLYKLLNELVNYEQITSQHFNNAALRTLHIRFAFCRCLIFDRISTISLLLILTHQNSVGMSIKNIFTAHFDTSEQRGYEYS
jgi:hypothetical protein